jgi:hypothetical protein
LWEKIERCLDGAETGLAAGETLASLPAREPDPLLWERIEAALDSPAAPPLLSRPWLRYAGVMALVLVWLSSWIWFLSEAGRDRSFPQEEPAGQISQGRSDHRGLTPSGSEGTQADIKQEEAGRHIKISPVVQDDETLKTQSVREAGVDRPSSDDTGQAGVLPAQSDHEKITLHNAGTLPGRYGIGSMPARAAARFSLPPLPSSGPGTRSTPGHEPALFRDPYVKGRLYSLGLSFSCEKMSNHGPGQHPGSAFRVELTPVFNFSGLLVQTGAGLSSSSDSWDYYVSYLETELVGSYARVDSIIYIYDSITFSYRKQYVTSLRYVYDSLQGQLPGRVENRYLHLYFPLLAGYQKDFGRFSWNLKAGPVLSVLVMKEQSRPPWEGQGMAILAVDDKTPRTLQTSLHMRISAGMTYRLSDAFSLTLEPVYNYYFKPYYHTRNGAERLRTASYGISAGMLVNF